MDAVQTHLGAKTHKVKVNDDSAHLPISSQNTVQ